MAREEENNPHQAGKVLAWRGEKVIEQLSEAVRPENAEGIHDLRVAIRRLRTAMQDLGSISDKKAGRKLDKELKAIADLAGKVRDHDVAIAVLEKLAGEAEAPQILLGINEMIAGRRSRRDADHQALLTTLSPKSTEELAARIRKIASFDEGVATDPGIAAAVIGERCLAFLELVPSLYDPADTKRHHRLRIAAKRLRYSAELFDPPADNENSAPRLIAEMQDHLGDMHDCDVWIRTLSKNLKRYVKNAGEASPEFLAAEWLLGEFVRRRAKHYREALRLWMVWEQTGFIDSMLSTSADQSPETEIPESSTSGKVEG
ncbi:MAG: CHAD domain-containing protein [Acidobacteria bacterium]|nr:CHAD domain-containing protein [Acidobacteriota bacterium]